jgi:hypothetical protein
MSNILQKFPLYFPENVQKISGKEKSKKLLVPEADLISLF